MPANTPNGVPYPLGTDRLSDGDDAIHNLALWVDDAWNTRARIYKNAAAQTLASGTATPITMDAEETDLKGMHDIAVNPSRITISRAGRYLVTGSVQFAAVAGVSGYRRAFIWKNGVAVAAQGNAPVNSATQFMNVVVPVLCIVGDYIELVGQHNQGANLDVLAGFNNTWLDVTYAGNV